MQNSKSQAGTNDQKCNEVDGTSEVRQHNTNAMLGEVSMNLHERCELEKSKTHVCKNCYSEIIGWTVDCKTNSYLECFCRKCKTWNTYKYWGW